MEAGRELDALVAEKIMGWSNCHREGDWGYFGRPFGGPTDFRIPNYSTDISAAWEVMEKMLFIEGFSFCIEQTVNSKFPTTWFLHTHHKGILCIDEVQERYSSTGVIEHSICLAALKSVGHI